MRRWPLRSPSGALEQDYARSIGAGRTAPVRVLNVELSEPLPDLADVPADGHERYREVTILLRLHGKPLANVALEDITSTRSARDLAARLWTSAGPKINEHLRTEGLPPLDSLPPTGIISSQAPRCTEARERARINGPSASVIVATHERPNGLRRTLNSIVALEYSNIEVIVVDNAPRSTTTRDLIRDEFRELDNVRYVIEHAVGLTRARLKGVEVATGEIVAFTDDDVIVDRHWLSELATGFAFGDDVACVTGLTLPLELETPAQVWFEEYGGFSKGFSRRVFNLREHRPAGWLFPYAVGRVGSGNNMAWRAELLRDMGGFDPALNTTGAEDISAFFDAITRGFTIVYEPAAIVFHEHRREFADLERQMYWYGIGLGAYLTRCLLSDSSRTLTFLARAPFGVAYLLNSRSAKNRRKSPRYPKKLTRLERRGTFRGVIAYLRGRRKVARARMT
jgi:GT2 family glycosyltransferase